MENGGRRQAERAPDNNRRESRTGTAAAAWLTPESVRRYLQIALGLLAGFILGTMAVQSWTGYGGAERDVRERIRVALEQGSVPINLFFSETASRLKTLQALPAEVPGNITRLDPGYRRYDRNGAAAGGGPPIPQIAEAAAQASASGVPMLSTPFEGAGLWYAAIVRERRDVAGTLQGYEGIQFPVTRILDWWSTMRLPPGSSTALVTADGRIWLRDPFVPAVVGSKAANDPFAAAVKADSSYLSRIVAYDEGGVDAIVGWRSLESFGLVLSIGIDRDQVPAEEGPSMLPLLMALLMTGAVFLVVTFMGRLTAIPMPTPREHRPVPEPAPPPKPAARPATPAPGRSLRAAAEKMPVVLYEQRVGPNLEVSFDYVSRGIRNIHGIEPAQIESNPEIMFEIVHATDRERVEQAFRHAWETGEDLDMEYRIVMPDGSVKWVHNIARSGGPGEEGGATVWDGLMLDVTAQKAMEKELEVARSEAEVTSRSKAQFLANVSHELRTPLNAIIGFSEVISEQTFGPVGVDKYLEYARDIHESADHLLAVVNDILDLSKIEAGRATIVLEDVEAAELVDACLRLIHGRAAEHRLELRRRVEDSLPLLRVDSLKVKQILINLLANAVKFTREGGTVTLSAFTTPDGGIAFSVSDTGIGIAEEDLSKVIETYGQVEQEPGREVEGTGLGLPLAKALAELHGGTLSIQSLPGKGTTVEVRFPPSSIARAKRSDA